MDEQHSIWDAYIRRVPSTKTVEVFVGMGYFYLAAGVGVLLALRCCH